LQKWIESGDERDQKVAFWLMQRHRDSCEDTIVRVCTPLLDRGQQEARQVFGLLNHEVHRDSGTMFRLRLKCISAGAGATYVNWKAPSNLKRN
jgi:hypothetical protein